MYTELIEEFVKAGASQILVESTFGMKKYDRPGLPEYVLKRLKRAAPVDVDNWLKLSVRYCLKTFKDNLSEPVVTARKKVNMQRSATMKNKHVLDIETERTEELKREFDKLPIETKQIYLNAVMKKYPDAPPFLVEFKSFLMYCEKKEEKEVSK